MSKIIFAGVAVLDFVFQVEEFPAKPEKYRANGAYMSGGGNAANAAVASSRLGADAWLASRLGDDTIANLIVQGLKEERVHCDHIKQFANTQSSFSSIYIDPAGERQIMNFRDHKIPMTSDWLANSLVPEFNAAMADTRWPDGAFEIMKFAKTNNIPGVMDTEAPVREALAAVECASHVAFSAQGVREFTGIDNVEKATKEADKQLDGKVLATDGENGVVEVCDQTTTWHKAYKIDVVDTLAAGDTWHGAFTLALARKQPESYAIQYANAAAAVKCSRTGGREGAPTHEETIAFMELNS